MRVLLYGSRGDLELMAGLAVQLGAEECDGPAAISVMPTGGWR